jgi:8-oxo-dGTP diphosphatase
VRALIVAAGLIAEEERILVTQRKEGATYGLYWEFPGGKIEEGEEPRQALQRELKEELRIDCSVGHLFEVVFHNYPDYSVLLLVYRCEIEEGIPQPVGCRDLRWVNSREMAGLTMLPADQSIQKRLPFDWR